MNCRWFQKSVLRTPIRAVSHARVFCQGAWRLEVLRGPILPLLASHSAARAAWSISIPIRATDPKTQSSWSLNWSCWPVKNASLTEQLQGAHLNSEQYVLELLKLFSLFWKKEKKFDSANCKRVGFFFHPSYHLRKLKVFSNYKTPKSGSFFF